MRDLELILTGSEARAAADELIAALPATEGGRSTPSLERLSAPVAEETPHRSLDPDTLITGVNLLLTIPASIWAVKDLVKQLKRRKDAEKWIDTATKVHIERRVDITIITLEGPRILADLTPDQILALVSPPSRK